MAFNEDVHTGVTRICMGLGGFFGASILAASYGGSFSSLTGILAGTLGIVIGGTLGIFTGAAVGIIAGYLIAVALEIILTCINHMISGCSSIIHGMNRFNS